MSVFHDSTDDNDSPSNKNSTSTTKHTPKTYEQYQQMRKEAPNLFFSAKMQNQMHEDAQALGKEKFFKKSNGKWWDRSNDD